MGQRGLAPVASGVSKQEDDELQVLTCNSAAVAVMSESQVLRWNVPEGLMSTSGEPPPGRPLKSSSCVREAAQNARRD
jgi:hypothetical protein